MKGILMPSNRLILSKKAQRTPESPISFYMEQAIENPKLISLAAGLVDTESLPVDALGEAIDSLWKDPNRVKVALQYGTTQGLLALRERTLTHIGQLDRIDYRERGISSREVVITTGSQQMLYLLCELLLDEGDIVITEAPSYFVFHSVLVGNGVRILTIPMDSDGMDINLLNRCLEDLEKKGELHLVKLIYTVDYFQNPSGRSLSFSRKQALMQLLESYRMRRRIMVLEDAAYRELRYEGEDVPSLKSLDVHDSFVIYSGTFSKPCSPGLKTGYSIVPKDLIPYVIKLEGNHDFGSGNFTQHLIEEYFEQNSYLTQVKKLCQIYREKRDVMLDALKLNFGDWQDVHWTTPKGGMFIWLTLPEYMHTGANTLFFKFAVEAGVVYVPGECSIPGENQVPKRNEMRISFGEASHQNIREGIHRLRRAADRVQLELTGSATTFQNNYQGERSPVSSKVFIGSE